MITVTKNGKRFEIDLHPDCLELDPLHVQDRVFEAALAKKKRKRQKRKRDAELTALGRAVSRVRAGLFSLHAVGPTHGSMMRWQNDLSLLEQTGERLHLAMHVRRAQP